MKQIKRITVNILSMVCFFSAPCLAQDATVIMQELSDIREDLKILQRQTYNTETSELEVKFGHTDELIRSTAGRLDEMEHKITELSEKIDLINKDMDIRMKLLEGKQISAEDMSAMPDNSPKFSAPVAHDAPDSIVGGKIRHDGDLSPIKKPTATDFYQEGLEALKKSDYTQAEEKFKIVLDKFSTDKLAGNAQYWLGETYYAHKQFDKAVIAFAKGYQNYKDGAKGADSLLKLGMSMQALHKKDEACAAFMSLKDEFPKADKILQDKAKDNAKKLGCK